MLYLILYMHNVLLVAFQISKNLFSLTATLQFDNTFFSEHILWFIRSKALHISQAYVTWHWPHFHGLIAWNIHNFASFYIAIQHRVTIFGWQRSYTTWPYLLVHGELMLWNLSHVSVIRDQPFNLMGVGGYVFLFHSEFFFRTRVRIIFFQNLTFGYMTKTLNQIIFFSSTKIRIFFSFFSNIGNQNIFLGKKPITPNVLQLQGL
jgi:hypothetical protein